MSHMANSSNVLGGLSRNDLRVKRADLVDLEVCEGLLSEMVLLGECLSLDLNDPLLFFLKFVFHFIIILT